MHSRNKPKVSLVLLISLPSFALAVADEPFIVQPRLRTMTQPSIDLTAPPQLPQPSKRHQDIDLQTPSWVGSAPVLPSAPTSILTTPAPQTELKWVRPQFPAPSLTASTSRSTQPPLARATATKTQQPPLQWTSRGNPDRLQLTDVVGQTPPGTASLEASRPGQEHDVRVAAPQVDPPGELPQLTAIAESPASDASANERPVLASLISSRIAGEANAPEPLIPMVAVDASPGWRAVGERLSQHLQASESLLRRNAFFSAREEAETAAIHLVRVLDLGSNSYAAEPQLLAARQALVEAEDFSFAQRMTSDQDFLQRVIQSHVTDVLKSTNASQVSPLVAAQHYRQFAVQSLVNASQGHPWASEIYYTLGRTYQAQADASDIAADANRWKAVTYYRAALEVAPQNAIAANQLGFILLQMDRAIDAREAIVASVQAELSTPALENLAEASRRLGDQYTLSWALQNLNAIQRAQPIQPATPQVTEVDPQTFMALSPYTIGPQPHAEAPLRTAAAASSRAQR